MIPTRPMLYSCGHKGEVTAAPSPDYPADGKSPLKCLPCHYADQGSPQWRDARYGKKEEPR